MTANPARYFVMVVASLALLASVGCEPSQPDAGSPATAPAAVQKPVLWKDVLGESVVAVDEPAVQRELTRATAEARRTLDDARQRWAVAKPEDHSLWAVKWAAPLAAGTSSAPQGAPESVRGVSEGVEYVWVQPLTWSAFRIEGVLLSTPTATLECGRAASERVSFPIDEISDWIHFATVQPDSAFEGGYTVKVLREHFGDATR